MWNRRQLLLLSAALAPCAAGMMPRIAQGLSPPRGEVVLTVTGAIGAAKALERVEFDLAGLEGLGVSGLRTWTPWTDGEIEFEGVLARSLMEVVGARGTEVHAVALNDYECIIPLEDFDKYAVMLATRMNGQRMQVRDKGPIWVVYPWSDHPELDDFATREKSIWQLSTLHVR